MTTANTQRIKAAHHQAGHAVVACFMDVPFKHASIYADALEPVIWMPRRVPEPVNPWNAEEWKERKARSYWQPYIFAFLAGLQAERLYDAPIGAAQANSDAGDDDRDAYVIADYFYEPARAQSWLNEVRRRTLVLLRFPEVWRAVELVAHELLDQWQLTAKEVHALVDPLIGNRAGQRA